MGATTGTGKGRIDTDGIVSGLGRGISSVTMAIAELIDNAIAATPILPGDIDQHSVQVLIRFKQEDSGLMSMVIRDTAAGMSPEVVSDKLFNYAQASENSTNLNEFGVGAKEALGFLAGSDGHFTLKSIWFNPATNKRIVTSIGKTSLKEIYPEFTYETRDAESDEQVGTQWTVLGIKGGFSPMEQQTMFQKMLSSLYRKPLREGRLVLKGEDSLGIPYTVSYSEPELLEAYPVKSSNEPDFSGNAILWRVNFKDIEVVVPTGITDKPNVLFVSGWVGLLAQLSDATGISIIRRDRVVQMGGKLQWTPKPPFKNAGSHRDKRLVGEIVCDNIPTSKVKSEVNELVAVPIAKMLDSTLHTLQPSVLSQADHFRVREYEQALREYQHGTATSIPAGGDSAGAQDGESGNSGRGGSATRNGAGPSDEHSLIFGSFTSPVDSRTFTVLLKSRQKSGSSTEWEWSKSAAELEIAVSPLIMQIARNDQHDERLVPYVSLLVALALVEREGQDSDGVIERVARLARILKPE